MVAVPASLSHARHLHEPPWLGWLVLEHTGNALLARWGTLGAHWITLGTHWEHTACPVDHTGIALPPLWIMLPARARCLFSGSHWVHTGSTVGSRCLTSRLRWDHTGLVLGSPWAHTGLTLPPLRISRRLEHAACPHMAFFRFTNMRAPNTRCLPPSFPVSHQPRHRHRPGEAGGGVGAFPRGAADPS